MFEQKTFSLVRLAAAKVYQLSFLSKSKYRAELASNSAGAIILYPDHAADFAGNCLFSLNPYLSYAKASAPVPVYIPAPLLWQKIFTTQWRSVQTALLKRKLKLAKAQSLPLVW
ncbi:MAG: UDP-3-O-[3-hydroxymyristoyl] glucosamine N-acyltransferase [Zhongshania sp.]|jgi:UDP-3-O-[3-hydroxymyristoyl] glucosamine N-acyltransferase